MLFFLILIAGFVPLILGANFIVESASSLAKKLNIPNIVIGLTIVAFGTSAPELVVNVFASAGKNTEIALGNIIGSNIFNILFILGISAVVYPLAVKTNTTWIEIPLCLMSAIVVMILANDMVINQESISRLSRSDGIILLFFFVVFIVYNIQLMRHASFDELIAVKPYSIAKSIFLIFAGIILLIVGGKMIVYAAIRTAQFIGLSERIIALTIVSAGTSLPELATSIVAARKSNVDIAIGNIVGSNIFNVFFILGISAVIYPVSLQKMSNIDMTVNIAASVFLFVFIFTGNGRKLDRWEGVLFIIGYLAYIVLLFSY
jgi:cation:H+ antiporter